MWINKQVYFISDRNRVKNIYLFNEKSNTVEMISNEKNWDIISADSFGSQIIYETAGILKILDTNSRKTSKVTISINPDLPELRTQWKDAMKSLESAKLSATGKRALISARGEIFTVPLKDGSTRNLTQTDGIRERDALWSPKGDKVAFTSDKGGIQKLVITNQSDNKSRQVFKLGKPADYQLILYSNDGSKIIYSDNHLNLWSINTKTGKKLKITTDNRRGEVNISLSQDGRWLAYTKAGANYFNNIYLYDFKKSRSHLITDGMSHANSPVFSPDGKYLYFTASTNAGTTAVGLDMSSQERPLRNGIYAVVLSSNGKSPLLPKSDEEEVNKTDDDKDEDQETDKNATTKIDIKNITQRIVALPVTQRAYFNLAVADDNNLYYIQAQQPGISIDADGGVDYTSKLIRFDFEELSAESILDDVSDFSLSADGKVILVINDDGQLKTAKIDKDIETKKLNTSEVKVSINPKAEWRQIFDEVWRAEQEFFYAKNMHGLDWQKIGEQYRQLLPHVVRRADLNSLMVEMIAQMEVGHNRVYGGDLPRQPPVKIGLLGVDLRVKKNQYKINKIYNGENWNPSIISPLSAPGIGIKTGDTIHSVNGIKLDASINIYSLFENTVDKQVTLQVSSNGQLKIAKKVIIKPIANERSLRFWHWVESNRKTVSKLSNGKVGYVYLPNTASGGFTFFNRMFFAQTDKEAMIIDERQNGGGQAANYITDILSRQYLAAWKDRDGMIFETPGAAVYGPKVMLIDQDAGSGGDFLPYSFKRMGIGKLIGKTTWGGLIGIAANRSTIDGGQVLVPYFRFFTPENEWRVENEGVSPDIDVTLDPTLVNKGKDSQLSAAVEETLSQLKTYKSIKLNKAPPLPSKAGM